MSVSVQFCDAGVQVVPGVCVSPGAGGVSTFSGADLRSPVSFDEASVKHLLLVAAFMYISQGRSDRSLKVCVFLLFSFFFFKKQISLSLYHVRNLV